MELSSCSLPEFEKFHSAPRTALDLLTNKQVQIFLCVFSISCVVVRIGRSRGSRDGDLQWLLKRNLASVDSLSTEKPQNITWAIAQRLAVFQVRQQRSLGTRRAAYGIPMGADSEGLKFITSGQNTAIPSLGPGPFSTPIYRIWGQETTLLCVCLCVCVSLCARMCPCRMVVKRAWTSESDKF